MQPINDFGRVKDPCSDCVDGRCTMNCSGREIVPDQLVAGLTLAERNLLRDALVCAFLEGGSYGWDAHKEGASPETVSVATDEYVQGALPNVERALADARSITIPAEIADVIREIGRAEWGSTKALTANGHSAHIFESVNETAKHFGQTEPQPMHGLYVEGTETVICHTGTSPNSPVTARALTGIWNAFYEQCSAVGPDPNAQAQPGQNDCT